ncbi:cupin domain-containing protein [Mucilaginibacter mali]|uniref:Cupin domain-containing protein n=1 Tax=Mucilaginibacter mali TaxID=2740462 RepID=A0A7D4PS38_9SPHI|nr:cupin domain-containing protein [Mucilaginibacter mali]QKJ28708.1 cupin domain-containing protein [Mucilaginibacter mali]
MIHQAFFKREGEAIPPLGGEGVHYEWGNGCHGWTFVDTDALSVKQELMPPNTSEALHYHTKATQFFFIIKGSAIFYVDGVVKILTEHQGIEILPGQHHRISNHSEADLEFTLYSHPSTKHDRVNIETP